MPWGCVWSLSSAIARDHIGEHARQTMLAIFQILPPESELVTEMQRQLSFVLMD